jgi:hypothetical protein
MRRLDFVGLSAAGIAGALLASQARGGAETSPQVPLVPFQLYSYHWDDHYFAWLPGHPRFESIELMTVSRGPSVPPLRWAFLTERAAPKRQIHYYNDAAIAKASGGTYASIALTLGPANAAGLARATIRFRGEDGDEVRWTLSFAPTASFASAGLTDQSGHDAADVTLFFYREKVAYAERARVTIGGVSYVPSLSRAGGGSAPPAAYSRNIFTAIVPYEAYSGRFDGDALRLDDGRSMRLARNGLGPGGSGGGGDALVLSLRGANPVDYRLVSYGHSTAVAFGAPLQPGRCTFSLSFDGFARVLQGVARVSEDGRVSTLAFEPLVPGWARSYAFTTRFERTSAGFTASTRGGLHVPPGRAP